MSTDQVLCTFSAPAGVDTVSTQGPTDLTLWFRDVFNKIGISQTEFAKLLTAELKVPFQNHKVHKLITGERQLSYKEVIAVANLSNTPLPNLHRGRKVPVVGAIRSGGRIVLYLQPVEYVSVPPTGDTNLIALEVVNGDAAPGVAYGGQTLLFDANEEAVSPALNDLTLLVIDKDGNRTLRTPREVLPKAANIAHVHRLKWILPAG